MLKQTNNTSDLLREVYIMNLKTAEKRFFIAQRKAKMNIEQYFNELIKREGGYLNNPTERGGATKSGITEGSPCKWLQSSHARSAIKCGQRHISKQYRISHDLIKSI